MNTPKQMEDKNSPGLQNKLKELGFEATTFEPKVKNRFIINVDGIPSYTLKAVNLPTFSKNGGWGFLELELYNPVGQDMEERVLHITKKDEVDIKVTILSPTAEVDTTWEIIGLDGEASFGKMDWSDDGEPHYIYLRFRVKTAKLSY